MSPAKTRKKRKVVKKTKEEKLRDAKIRKLVTKGKKQGYLTIDDVMAFFPEAEDDLDALDALYERLLKEGVDVFDVTSQKEAEEL